MKNEKERDKKCYFILRTLVQIFVHNNKQTRAVIEIFLPIFGIDAFMKNTPPTHTDTFLFLLMCITKKQNKHKEYSGYEHLLN